MYRIGFSLYRKVMLRNRTGIKPIALWLSNWFDRKAAPGAVGDHLVLFANRLLRDGRPVPARLVLFVVLYSLVISAQAHMGASQHGRMFKTARLINLLFRPYILARRAPVADVYFQVLLHLKQFERIARDLRRPDGLDDRYLATLAGVAHLNLMNVEAAKQFLTLAISLNGADHFAHRMLGRVHLVEGDYGAATREFSKSVKILPSTVMAHQNYAGRYEVLKSKPKQWELRRAGTLLVYDNLVQLAEDLFLQGRFNKSFRFYQLALLFQSRLADQMRPHRRLPTPLLKRIGSECDGFDPALSVRILPYEWVTQFGHIGLLDAYRKMAALGTIAKANYVLLAPQNKVSNSVYLAYWDRYFCIVRDDKLVDDLFPYQRYFGDQFMALLAEGPLAEPWTRAAARTQVEWAKRGHGPLLQLSEQHRTEGQRKLQEMGLPAGAWYVGLHIREGGFYGDGTGTIGEHRSADVKDYLEAIDEVTSRGGWVIRLGDASMTPLPSMPNVIDYAHCAAKSADMDLFFLATSRLIIGTTSGLSTVAMSFGTAMLLVNCISNDWQIWTAQTDFTVKQVYDLGQRRYLSLTETYQQPFQGRLINHALLTRHGYAIHPNSAADTRAAVRDKLDTVLGIAAPVPEDDPLMRRYRQALSHNPFMFGAARPSLPFLNAHPELFGPPPDHESLRPREQSAA